MICLLAVLPNQQQLAIPECVGPLQGGRVEAAGEVQRSHSNSGTIDFDHALSKCRDHLQQAMSPSRCDSIGEGRWEIYIAVLRLYRLHAIQRHEANELSPVVVDAPRLAGMCWASWAGNVPGRAVLPVRQL